MDKAYIEIDEAVLKKHAEEAKRKSEKINGDPGMFCFDDIPCEIEIMDATDKASGVVIAFFVGGEKLAIVSAEIPTTATAVKRYLTRMLDVVEMAEDAK